jgi:ParB-like chromosome segregation protein Spo0J
MENDTDTTVPADESVADVAGEQEAQKGAEQFIADFRVDELLRAKGLSYDMKIVAIADIELSQLDGGDSHWQMRDQVLDPVVAQRYGDDLGWGTKFPAGVLAKNGSRYEVVDFHHRIDGARRADFTHVTAYVLGRMKEADRILLGFELNRNHGKALSDSERVREGVRLIRLGHFATAREAARVLGTDEGRVNKARRLEDAQQKAAEAGVSMVGWARLGKNSQERLGSIEAPGVFREAVNKTLENGLPHEKVNEMVKAVNAAASEADKIEAVRNYGLSDDARPSPLRGLADAWNRCHMANCSLLGVDDHELGLSLGRRTDTDAQQLLDEFTNLAGRLQGFSTIIRRHLDAGAVADAG